MITVVVSRVPDEDASRGARAQLVSCCSHSVGVAQRAEYAEAAIVRRRTEEQLVRGRRAGGRTGMVVE